MGRSDRSELLPVVDELGQGVPQVEANDLQHVNGVSHGWYHIWQFPRGIYWPLCLCGFLPDDGFTSVDDAIESRCERQRF